MTLSYGVTGMVVLEPLDHYCVRRPTKWPLAIAPSMTSVLKTGIQSTLINPSWKMWSRPSPRVSAVYETIMLRAFVQNSGSKSLKFGSQLVVCYDVFSVGSHLLFHAILIIFPVAQNCKNFNMLFSTSNSTRNDHKTVC